MNAAYYMRSAEARLLDTRRAFDRVAATYDGPRGNNEVIQRMRRTMWTTILRTFPRGARLADLGCGTGLDAAYLGRQGYRVSALDWSPEMVSRTRHRIDCENLENRVETHHLAIHELESLNGGPFDGMYSNLGAMNCVQDLAPVASACAKRLRRRGILVFSVIGRFCPWEIAFYLLRAEPRRAFVRFRRRMQPVNLNGGTVWTHYYTPREFHRHFEAGFALSYYRTLGLFSPPPYLIAAERKAPSLCKALAGLDDLIGDRPVFRNAGDHFMIILRKRD